MPTSQAPQPARVAVLRFGAAGDVLLCAPTLAALRRAWPDTHVTFVTHPRYATLVRGWPAVDEVLALDRASVWAWRRALRARRIEAVLDLHASTRSRLLTLCLWPKRRATWQKRALKDHLATLVAHAPYRPRSKQTARSHAALERLVGRVLPAEPLVHIGEPAAIEEGQRAWDALDLPLHQPVVLVHPGANWPTKRYPVRLFAAAMQSLSDAGCSIVGMGGPTEQPLLDQLVALCPSVRLLQGPLSLAGLAGFFPRADVLVVGDTGPMHVARGVQLPCVILFGSTPAAAFDLTGHTVLTADVDCAPCSFYGLSACPRGHLRCLTEIQPDAIVKAVNAVLQRRLRSADCNARPPVSAFAGDGPEEHSMRQEGAENGPDVVGHRPRYRRA